MLTTVSGLLSVLAYALALLLAIWLLEESEVAARGASPAPRAQPMLPTRRVAASILALALAAHLLGCGGNATLALLSDTETDPATFATAACFIADNVPPSVSSTVISKTVPYLPGFIRQGGTYYVYANVTDGGCAPSGIATVRANVSTVTTGSTAVALVRRRVHGRRGRLQLPQRVADGQRDPRGGCQGLHHHLDRQRRERPDPDGLQRDRRQHRDRPDRTSRPRTVARPSAGRSLVTA